MSWLSDLAGKAEGFLNQIDQGAASALQKKPSSIRSVHSQKTDEITSSSTHSAHATNTYTQDQYRSSRHEAEMLVRQETPKREHRSSGYASSVSSAIGVKVQAKEDQKLIDFLNEPAGSETRVTETGESRPPTVSLSRRSSSSSLRSLPAHLFNISGSTTDVPLAGAAQKADTEHAPTTAPYEQLTSFVQTKGVSEREFRELLEREMDLQKALQAKDSQLAVLRVRLQEADQQLQSKSSKLQRLESEQQRLVKDSANSSAFCNQALESVQQQLTESFADLERERAERKQIENEYLRRIERLEHEQSDFVQQLTAAQKSLTEEKLTSKQASEQLKLAKYNLEANKQEFDEYKNKAQRILQSKEKLIATLKEEDGGHAVSEHTNLKVELEELRTERDMFKEDLQQTQLQLYNIKAEFLELESQLACEQRSSLEREHQLQEQCQNFQHTSMQYREQLEQLKQEYQYMQDEARRQQSTLQLKLKEKDVEITKLMSQASARTSSLNGDASEYEARIRQLGESLIQKQTLIETLQTERQSLQYQLERTERLYQEAESAAIRSSSTVIHMDDEGVHARVPSFLRETPQDTGVTRGVKRAYSTLDSLSVRVGVFLRRYPMARVFVFFYMILLHFWVMIVLLTYTPEAHSPEYHNGQTVP